MLFFQDTRLPVTPDEQYDAEQIAAIESERRQNRNLSVFWGAVAVPATLIAVASFAMALVMLFRLMLGRPELVNFFVFGIMGALLLTPAYLFRQFRGRMRLLDEVLSAQTGEPGASPETPGDAADAPGNATDAAVDPAEGSDATRDEPGPGEGP
jgi:hypothetical protein